MTRIATIGYERTDPEKFVAALRADGVDLLVDVRMIAFSHKPGFSKTPLRQILEAADIGYLHLEALGNPKAGRDAAKAGNRSEFHRIYRTQMATGAAIRAMEEIASRAAVNRVCLMCFERDHADCHRDLIAETMESNGISVTHLLPVERDAPLRRVRSNPQGTLL